MRKKPPGTKSIPPAKVFRCARTAARRSLLSARISVSSPWPGAFPRSFATRRCISLLGSPALCCQQNCLVIRFSRGLQLLNQLVKQIFQYLLALAHTKPGKCCVVRHVLITPQSYEVHTVPAGFLQFPAGVDPAQVPIYQHLGYHPWIGRRFSPSGRILFVQFPLLQFCMLGASQSDGCVLWYHFFTIQCKYQLTSAFIYATLVLLLVFSTN